MPLNNETKTEPREYLSLDSDWQNFFSSPRHFLVFSTIPIVLWNSVSPHFFSRFFDIVLKAPAMIGIIIISMFHNVQALKLSGKVQVFH